MAAVWSLAFAWAAQVQLPLWVPVLLVLVVWPVYVGDRLLDARTGLSLSPGGVASEQHALRERHYFHWRHRRILSPLACATACAAAGVILVWMPDLARERDSFLAAAFFAYFIRVHLGGRPRPVVGAVRPPLRSHDFIVALLFTAGCVLPVFSASPRAPHWPLLGLTGLYSALAWLNCHAIDCWEHRSHRARHLPALTAAAFIAFVGAGMSLCLLPSHPRLALLCGAVVLSALLLALLDAARNRIGAVTLRAAADLALLTPLLLLPLRWLAR